MIIENPAIKAEAAILSEQILEDIELSNLPLSSIVLKAGRLARLCGEEDFEKIFEYESSGYPSNKGYSPEIWKYLKLANRVKKNDKGQEVADGSSIQRCESIIETDKIALSVSADPNISLSSANPSQFIASGHTNLGQRNSLINNIVQMTTLLAERRAFIHKYVKDRYMELKFSTLTGTVWTSVMGKIDELINKYVPQETQKLTTIYENLKDDNPEKWSLALTSCRRMLKSLADKIYPPSSVPIKKNKKTIEIDNDNFINRLICYIDDNLTSKTSQEITNGNLKYIGERLDAIKDKTSKGVHGIVDKDEAERCFMYTYLIIGDILRVVEEKESHKSSKSLKEG